MSAPPIPLDELRKLVKDAKQGCGGGDPWGECPACKAEHRLKGWAVWYAEAFVILSDRAANYTCSYEVVDGKRKRVHYCPQCRGKDAL